MLDPDYNMIRLLEPESSFRTWDGRARRSIIHSLTDVY